MFLFRSCVWFFVSTALMSYFSVVPVSAQTIGWAGTIVSNSGVRRTPIDVLGRPDNKFITVDGPITLGAFGASVPYNGLADLIGVSPSLLERANVIGFEGNGIAAAPSGGWESARWTFEDGIHVLTVDFDERIGQPVPPSIIANGSISGAQYDSFFHLKGAVPVTSYILFDLPGTIDTASPNFTVTLTGGNRIGLGGEGTPDPDAVGVLRSASTVPEPGSFALLIGSVVIGASVYLRQRHISFR